MLRPGVWRDVTVGIYREEKTITRQHLAVETHHKLPLISFVFWNKLHNSLSWTICIYLLDVSLSTTLHLIYGICSVFGTMIFICSVNFILTPQLFSILFTDGTDDFLLWENGLTMLWHSILTKAAFLSSWRRLWRRACWPIKTPATNIHMNDVPTQVFFIFDWEADMWFGICLPEDVSWWEVSLYVTGRSETEASSLGAVKRHCFLWT